MKKTIRILLPLFLLFALLLSFAACGEEKKDLWEDAVYLDDTTLGEGTKTVELEIEADGRSITVTLKTDEDILGTALLAHGLIEGEEGQYGLYVKRVNGILSDYDVDQTYWAVYRGDEYMMTGVDSIEIKGGEHFKLVRTK